MHVRATKKGYYVKERAVGEVFSFPDNMLKKDKDGKPTMPSWFVPAKDSEIPKPNADRVLNGHGKLVDSEGKDLV